MAGVKKISGATPVWPTNKDQRNTNAGEDGRKSESDEKNNVEEGSEDHSDGKIPPEGQGGNVDEFV